MKTYFYTFLSISILSLWSILPVIAQPESKVAVLIVSGSGRTQDEAKQNALRNAIEQAFGTFISSNTKILNDKLVRDEIVSVSNGNIQGFAIISEVQNPNGSWSNTLKAKVAIDKLTSFCESKGVNIEFKGSLFAVNIKQQILNEQNELTAIKNMRFVLKNILNRSFDFTISAGQPTSTTIRDEAFGKIPIIVEGTLNNNFKNVSIYLFNTLKGLTCNQSEIDTYANLNKPLYFVAYKPMGAKDKEAGLFALRNIGSFEQIKMLISDIRDAFINITINNGVESIKLNELRFLMGSENYPDLSTTHKISSDIAQKYSQGSDYSREKRINIPEIMIKSVYFNPALGEDFYKYPDYPDGHYTRPDYDFLNRNEKHYGGITVRNDNDSYIEQNFKFISKWDLSFLRSFRKNYREDIILVISFANLKIGISKGIIQYDNVYNLSTIQKITNFSVNPNNY